MRVPVYVTVLLWIVLLHRTVEGGKMSKKRSRQQRQGRSFVSDTNSPSFAPIYHAATLAPVMHTATKDPSDMQTNNKAEDNYEFSTAPASLPTSNAQTAGPTTFDGANLEGPTSTPIVAVSPTATPTGTSTSASTTAPTTTSTTTAPTTASTTAATAAATTLTTTISPTISTTEVSTSSPTAGQNLVLPVFTASPTLNAQTDAPHCTPGTPISNAETKAPVSAAPSTATPLVFPTMMLVPTSTPSMAETIAETTVQTTNVPTTAGNTTPPPTFVSPMIPVPGAPSTSEVTTAPTSVPLTDAPTAVDALGTPPPTFVSPMIPVPGAPSTSEVTTAPTSVPSGPSLTDAPTAVDALGTPPPTLVATIAPSSGTIGGSTGISPSPLSVLPAQTSQPVDDNSTVPGAPADNITWPIGNGTTAVDKSPQSCSSNDGAFFLLGDIEIAGNETSNETIRVSSVVDMLYFLYELESRVDAQTVLPSLEVAFVDSLLADLFPFACQPTSVNRFLETPNNGIIGISSKPTDEITDAECQVEPSTKNSCVVVEGQISIYSTDGLSDEELDAIREALYDTMSAGTFADSSLGIVSVLAATGEIVDETITDETDGINESEENEIVQPSGGDRNAMLGIGFGLSAAAVVLIGIGASVYKRKQSAGQDTSTLHDATMNGLSRFDNDQSTADDTKSARDVEIMPLSPAARTSAKRYSTGSQSSALLQR
ncbi:expressed unknown protein [Seminavis robusta]|uniref:Uncharacterized protein n=1 Tax=Seminavis robusta TaxID=568900 RepID=A0A9N8EBF7_9STRA|nr:expressed unknown protein [Seminavis robusta]|eukprot:Sro841_g209510.1 n/a (712) ;mRNA; f:14811-17116